MTQLFRFLNQILFLFVLLLSIKHIDAKANSKLTSIFYGVGGWHMEQIGNISLWLGKHPTVIVFFTDWCNNSIPNMFNMQLNNLWNSGSIPLLTWTVYDCTYKPKPGIIKLVNNNTFDSYLDEYSDRLKIWLAGNDSIYGNDDDRRIYIRLAHEMNGNWFAWSQDTTPSEYVSAWRHVHNIFSSKNINSTRLQWIWSVNNNDVGSYTAEEYWVGDNYTDWLGIDGYNLGSTQDWSSWTLPNDIFDNMVGRLRKLSSTKPLSINEYGSTSIHPKNVSDVPLKNEWLNQFCDYMSNSQFKMASYFNVEQETDWAIFGGTHGDIVWNNFTAYSAYKNCLQSDEWILPNSTNKRILTDEQFAGIF